MSYCQFHGHADIIVTKELESESMTGRMLSGDFKLKAVRLVTDRGVATAQAASELDLAESVLRRWTREATARPGTAFRGNRQMRADLAEVVGLRKEIARIGAECDILKKAPALSRDTI